ncbi:hypothetical protein HYT45_04855 [Candidatus Uhrbacteria bacterium]|nr:hypothetical protein [Candidatus Uhrbacteria bacterium]
MRGIDSRTATKLSHLFPIGRQIGTVGDRNVFEVKRRPTHTVIAFAKELAAKGNGRDYKTAIVLGGLSSQIICNIFRLLKEVVSVSFVEQDSNTSFVALACDRQMSMRMCVWRTTFCVLPVVLGNVQAGASIEIAHDMVRRSFLAIEEALRPRGYTLRFLEVTLGVTTENALVIYDVRSELRAPNGDLLFFPRYGDILSPEDTEPLRLAAELTESFCPQPAGPFPSGYFS